MSEASSHVPAMFRQHSYSMKKVMKGAAAQGHLNTANMQG